VDLPLMHKNLNNMEDTVEFQVYRFKDQMQCFLVVKVNCSSSVFNDDQTHLNIEEDKNEQIVAKVSESACLKMCLHFASHIIPEKTTKTFLSIDSIAIFIIVKCEY